MTINSNDTAAITFWEFHRTSQNPDLPTARCIFAHMSCSVWQYQAPALLIDLSSWNSQNNYNYDELNINATGKTIKSWLKQE